MKEELLELASHLVGEQAKFELHTWGAAARRLFALHKLRYPLANEKQLAALDHDFEAFAEVFSSSAFRYKAGTMFVLGFEDRESSGREELSLWLDPAAWKDECISGAWRLREHTTRRGLHRLTRTADDLSYWFQII